MKKIVTIVVLVLALTLVASIALAVNYTGKFDSVWRLEELMYQALSESPGVPDSQRVTINDIRPLTVNPSLDQLYHIHNQDNVYATVTGRNVNTGDIATTEIVVDCSGHWWDLDDEESIPATCTADGVKVWYCSYPGCGASEIEVVPATGHTYVDKYTCGKDGKSWKECSACGAKLVDKMGNVIYGPGRTDHEFLNSKGNPNLVLKSGLTCSAFDQHLSDGVVINACVYCGEANPDWEKAENEKGEYTITGETDDAKVKEYNKVFGSDKTVKDFHKLESHHYKDYPATCTTPAQYSLWCKVCGYEPKFTVKDSTPLGHNWALASGEGCWSLQGLKDKTQDFQFVCTRCDASLWVLADASNITKMDDAGVTVLEATIEFDYINRYHDPHDQPEHHSVVIAHNFEEEGISGYYVPVLDGVGNPNHAELRWALGELDSHGFEKDCTSVMVKKNMYCSKCGQYHEVYEWLGHDWNEWEIVVDKDAAQTSTHRWQSTCKHCNMIRVQVSATQPVDECAPEAHNWVPEDPTTVKCGEQNPGTKLVCTICGAKKVDYFNIPGHDYVFVAYVEAPTCEKAGRQIVRCSICNELAEIEAPLAAHTLKPVEGKAATCKEAGYAAYLECEKCGKKFDAVTKEAITAPVVIEKTEDHVWDEGKVTKEATVEADGEKTYTCTICGKKKTEVITKLVPPTEIDELKTEFDKKDNILSGKAAVKEGTQEPKALFARITLFFANGTYNVGSVQLADDGTFEIPTAGDVVHYAVQIVDSNKVRPGTYNTFSTTEADVK